MQEPADLLFLSIPDEYASLLVCLTFTGDSHGVDTWYKLDPTGKITTVSSSGLVQISSQFLLKSFKHLIAVLFALRAGIDCCMYQTQLVGAPGGDLFRQRIQVYP